MDLWPIYFGEEWAGRWVTLGNRGSMFAGTTPIDYMIRQEQPGMFQVRRMLDAWRGGRKILQFAPFIAKASII
jgi:hypothetical protein